MIKIAGTRFDGRFALSPNERQLVKMLWDSHEWSLTEIADKFGTGLGTIKRTLGLAKARAKAQYRYNPNNKESVRKCRAKKKLLFKKSK